jgi:hypothetical protein
MSQSDSGANEDKPSCPECGNWSWVVVQGDDQRYCKTCGRVRKGLKIGESGFSGCKVRDYDYPPKVAPKAPSEGGCAYTLLLIGMTASALFIWG